MVSGSTVFITGGGSGLGAALARRFSEEGANVAIVDVDLDRSRAVAESLDPERVLPVAADVRSPEQLHEAVDSTLVKFGQINTVIPNAGIWDYNRSITRLSGEQIGDVFDEVMNINAKGALLTAEATWKKLIKTKGSMIFTLSNAAFYTAGGGPSYTASKFACRGIMLELAYELAPKVRVNGVAVGGMRTNLSGPHSAGLDNRKFSDVMDNRPEGGNPYIPLHHISTDPYNFTGPYVMLASDRDAGAITGTIIHADGGISARGFARISGGDDL